MTKETLNVKGMSCGHCVSAIEGSVGELEGVTMVKVDLDKSLVDIEYNADVVTLDKIKEMIDDQGYDIA